MKIINKYLIQQLARDNGYTYNEYLAMSERTGCVLYLDDTYEEANRKTTEVLMRLQCVREARKRGLVN